MAKKKNTINRKKNSLSRVFQKHKHLKWLLPCILVLLVIFLFVHYKKEEQPNTEIINDISAPSQTAFKTYTNTPGTVQIQYPSNWTVKETHEQGSDNPKVINTATLTGKEGQVVIQWGPMGFGGGCEEQDHKTFAIKNKIIDICNGLAADGTEYWSQIYNGTYDGINEYHNTSVRAIAYKPVSSNSLTIKTILSSLIFN